MNNKKEKPVFYNGKMLEAARNLRKNMTPQERHLWYDFLKSYQVKIYKQRPLSSYIVDFYCPRARLVIEIDGSQHYTVDGKEYDENRTTVLNELGLEVIRISNYDIDTNFEGVCSFIDKAIKEKLCLL